MSVTLFLKRFSCCIYLLFSFVAISGCSTSSSLRLQIHEDGTFSDTSQNLVWQQQKSRALGSANEAVQYTRNLRLAGHADWRLPTVAEFHNLYFAWDFGSKNQTKTHFKLAGNFWVIDDDGKPVVGSWNDTSEGCCIIREFLPNERGSVKAVRTGSKGL